MDSDETISRRSAMTALGVTASSLFLAGCGEEGPGGSDEGNTTGDEGGAGEGEGEEPAEDEDSVEEGAENESEGEEGDENQSDSGENNESDGGDENESEGGEGEGDENESDGGGEGETDDEWADVEEIVLSGYVSEWLGTAPQVIDQEENPTLVLYEGREYTITWQNEDGREHNLAIFNEDDELFQATDFVEEAGESVSLSFAATQRPTTYRCQNHPETMTGDIEIRSE